MMRKQSASSKAWSFTGVDDVIVDLLQRMNTACNSNASKFI
jgi:hypothetical protein